jgi:hypothetical protein
MAIPGFTKAPRKREPTLGVSEDRAEELDSLFAVEDAHFPPTLGSSRRITFGSRRSISQGD